MRLPLSSYRVLWVLFEGTTELDTRKGENEHECNYPEVFVNGQFPESFKYETQGFGLLETLVVKIIVMRLGWKHTLVVLCALLTSCEGPHHFSQLGVNGERAILSFVGGTPGSEESSSVSFNFGNTDWCHAVSQTFTVRNDGNVPASGISGIAPPAPYRFIGGSFPGEGGTCGTSLDAGSTCTLIVEFIPPGSSTYEAPVVLTYNDGSAGASTTANLSGQGTQGSSGGTYHCFGQGGTIKKVVTGAFVGGGDMIIQADGKMLLSNNAMRPTVARFNADGTPDLSFGISGIAEMTVPLAVIFVNYAMAQQSDGKLVVVGQSLTLTMTNFDFGTARFNADGTPDTGFGTNGAVLTHLNDGTFRADAASSVAIQGDGYIVVAGAAWGWQHPAMVRYDTTGVLDPLFGAGGIVVLSSVSGVGPNVHVVIQSNGRINLAYPDAGAFVVHQFNSDGNPNNAFGPNGDGTTSTNIGAGAFPAAIALDGSGNIYVAGTSGSQNMVVVRFDSDGNADNNFGTACIATANFGAWSVASSLLVQPDGKIVITGSGENLAYSAVARFNNDGSPDAAFGPSSDGKVRVYPPPGASGSNPFGVGLHDNQLFIGQYTYDSTDTFFSISSLWK